MSNIMHERAEWRFEDAKAYLADCQRDYADAYEDSGDEEEALGCAYGIAPSNADILKLIWASGQVAEAFDAVRGEIDRAIAHLV